MAIQFQGNGGVVAEVDENRNLNTNQSVVPGYPSAGGFYSVSGFTTTLVLASLAASTNLMTARLSTGSTRKAYITKFRLAVSPGTVGATGGIPATIGLVRFTSATPTGGTARTANRMGPLKGSATDITDIRDSNTALTVTSVVFGTTVASSLLPLQINATGFEWVAEFGVPVELSTAGDGIALQTLSAGPASLTWGFSYNLYWFER